VGPSAGTPLARSRVGRLLSLALRIGVAVGGLALAFRLALPASPEGGDGGPGVFGALLAAWKVPLAEALLWFGLAIAILGVSLVVGAVRFRVLLRGAGLDAPLFALLRAYVVATFFNLVLPGAMLGDVYRFFDARRDLGEGATVFGIVVLERLTALAALGCIALAVAPVVPRIQDDRRLLAVLVAAGGGCVAIALAVLWPPLNRLGVRIALFFAGRWPRIADALARSLEEVGAFAARRGVLARAFGWSLVNQGLPIAAIAALAVPLDALVPWYWFAVIVPFVTLVSMLPISIGGTGVRELLYVSLFGAVGMPRETALALSLSVLATALVWALLGLLAFASGRRTDRARAGAGA
jgi:hypothetical protein